MEEGGDWRPNCNLLAMWPALAGKRGKKLEVLVNKEGWVDHWLNSLPFDRRFQLTVRVKADQDTTHISV